MAHFLTKKVKINLMGRPKKPRSPRSNVVAMNPEPAENVAAVETEPVTPFDPPAPPENAAPAAAPPPQKRNPNFFERANAIPKTDWGTRAFIYVYCLEPICNLKMGGESKYLVRLSEPIADEQSLMVDYGSGKYRLQLVNRKAGVGKSDAIDTKEIEIYNPNYPPKIPRAVWMNDPRNERWAALLPKEEVPQPATGLGTLTDAFKTFGEIRRDLKEEMAPAASAVAPVAPPDPVEAGLRIANLMMTMKADNPMVEIMREQLKLASEAQQRALDREAALQKELREMYRPRQGEPEKKFGLREAIAELKDVLPTVKDLLPQVAETARAGRTNWLDVAREAAPTVIDWAGKIAYAFAARAPGPPLGPNGQPQQQTISAPTTGNGNGQPATAGAPPQEVPKFVRLLAQPTVFNSFQRYFHGYKIDSGQTGGDFANWVFDGEGIEPLKDARSMGTTSIMALLKQSPAWPLFASDEVKLVEFIDQALAWQPPAEEPDEEEDEEEAVDLTRKGV